MAGSSDRDRFERALAEGIGALGLQVPDHAVGALGQHYALLVRWAQRMNLTAVTDPVMAAHRHGLDCLLFADNVDGDADLEAVDVGSGAGFPGIALAVARPRLRMTLLEPIRKRTSFLRVVIAELDLTNVRVVDGKLAAPLGGRPWPADLIVSRATIPPLALIPLAAPALRPGGRLILTGGQGIPPESSMAARAAAAGLVFERRRGYVLPDGSSRWLDVLRQPGDARPRDG